MNLGIDQKFNFLRPPQILAFYVSRFVEFEYRIFKKKKKTNYPFAIRGFHEKVTRALKT